MVFPTFFNFRPVRSAQAAATGTLSVAEEPPHVQGQGQKPGGPHARRAAAKRRYPTSEVRGSGRECQAETAQERKKKSDPSPRSGAVAGRSYPASEIRGGREELPHAPTPEARGSGWEELPHAPKPEARGSGREEQPHVQGAVAVWAQEGLEELLHVQSQEGQP